MINRACIEHYNGYQKQISLAWVRYLGMYVGSYMPTLGYFDVHIITHDIHIATISTYLNRGKWRTD